ncbi:MAG: response regulator [Chitinispirillia bacterium]|nr:response regulator [Chitinispirillia bacterium]MCL2241359.1 response regulator [Chitinispirillia bacterium]
MKTIFVIDDNETNLLAAKTALDGVYRAFALQSPAKLFKLAEKIVPDLILLDVDMPEMDGFEVMAAIRADARLRAVPVIFLTAKRDAATEVRGFEMGALDFITKPFSQPILIRRIESHIETDRIIKESQRAVRDIHNATISVIADMVESRDKVTGGHIERTQAYLEILMTELIRTQTYSNIISGWDINLLLPSAQLHDVGKIAISDIILNKPGKLTEEEFGLIKTHCTEGEHIINRIVSKAKDDGFLRHAGMFAGYHHERWDGTGYPRGLAGEAIPLEGRIMAVADVYDALVSERPYKKPFTHEQAVEIITKESGSHFDPKIVEAFLNAAGRFAQEAANHIPPV